MAACVACSTADTNWGIVLQIVKSKPLDSALQVAEPPLQVLKPRVTSHSKRKTEYAHQFGPDCSYDGDHGNESLKSGALDILKGMLRELFS